MRRFFLTMCAAFFALVLSGNYVETAYCNEYSEVDVILGDMSAAAQKAMELQPKLQEQLESDLAEPIGRLINLKETIKEVNAGPGSLEYEQAMSLYKETMTKVNEHMKKRADNLRVIVEELEPKLSEIGYTQTPHDIGEYYRNQEEEVVYDDPFLNDIIDVFGLEDVGGSLLATNSAAYLDYKNQLNAYKRASVQLSQIIRRIDFQKTIAPLLSPEARGALKDMKRVLKIGRVSPKKGKGFKKAIPTYAR